MGCGELPPKCGNMYGEYLMIYHGFFIGVQTCSEKLRLGLGVILKMPSVV